MIVYKLIYIFIVVFLLIKDSQGETIRSVDWYIMPVLNPDGYEYSHNYDRMWRKNRSKHLNTPESIFATA